MRAFALRESSRTTAPGPFAACTRSSCRRGHRRIRRVGHLPRSYRCRAIAPSAVLATRRTSVAPIAGPVARPAPCAHACLAALIRVGFLRFVRHLPERRRAREAGRLPRRNAGRSANDRRSTHGRIVLHHEPARVAARGGTGRHRGAVLPVPATAGVADDPRPLVAREIAWRRYGGVLDDEMPTALAPDDLAKGIEGMRAPAGNGLRCPFPQCGARKDARAGTNASHPGH